MPFLPPNQQCQSTEGCLHTHTHIYIAPNTMRMKYDLQYQAKRVGSTVTSLTCNIISLRPRSTRSCGGAANLSGGRKQKTIKKFNEGEGKLQYAVN